MCCLSMRLAQAAKLMAAAGVSAAYGVGIRKKVVSISGMSNEKRGNQCQRRDLAYGVSGMRVDNNMVTRKQQNARMRAQ